MKQKLIPVKSVVKKMILRQHVQKAHVKAEKECGQCGQCGAVWAVWSSVDGVGGLGSVGRVGQCGQCGQCNGKNFQSFLFSSNSNYLFGPDVSLLLMYTKEVFI